jgi:hypothetical protein
MKNSIIDFNAPRWLQTLLPLTRSAEHISHYTSVDIPDLPTAKEERDRLKRKYGAANFAAKIGKRKSGSYALVYTVREMRTEKLF